MHSKSDNVEIVSGLDTNHVIEELINTFAKRYQEGLETVMKGSNYVFERVELLEYYFHKISLNRGGLYMPSPAGIKNKKATINPFNENDKICFVYAILIALNHNDIANNPQRVENLILFIKNFNWLDNNIPAGHKDYTAFEKNNKDIALNILFIPHDTQEIDQAYISKHNKTRNTQANLLMITNGDGIILQ